MEVNGRQNFRQYRSESFSESEEEEFRLLLMMI